MSGSFTACASILSALRWKLRGGALEEMIVAGGGGGDTCRYHTQLRSARSSIYSGVGTRKKNIYIYQRRRPAVTLLSGTEQG